MTLVLDDIAKRHEAIFFYSKPNVERRDKTDSHSTSYNVRGIQHIRRRILLIMSERGEKGRYLEAR